MTNSPQASAAASVGKNRGRIAAGIAAAGVAALLLATLLYALWDSSRFYHTPEIQRSVQQHSAPVEY